MRDPNDTTSRTADERPGNFWGRCSDFAHDHQALLVVIMGAVSAAISLVIAVIAVIQFFQ